MEIRANSVENEKTPGGAADVYVKERGSVASSGQKWLATRQPGGRMFRQLRSGPPGPYRSELKVSHVCPFGVRDLPLTCWILTPLEGNSISPSGA